MNAARRTAALMLAAAVGLAGCGGEEAAAGTGGRQGGPGGGGPGGGGPGGPGARIVPVEVAAVELGSIARSVTVTGVVEPIRSVAVNSQLAGAILALYAEEGAYVRRGQMLARLDDRELRAQLAAAEAAFQVAESSYERAEQLRERTVITLPEYERERTAYAAARAQLDQVRARVGYATVQAPITGVVTDKTVETGAVVSTQTRLFTLADVSTMVVRLGVSELDVVDLDVGDAVDVQLDAYPERPLRGSIRRIFPSADPATRLVPVEVALTGESARFARPGFLARGTFALGTRDGVLLVPASAIVRGAGSEAVFVIDQNKATRRSVTTGMNSRGRVEILQGLEANELVVTIGNNMLRDGAEVRIVGGDRATAAAVTEVAPAGTPAPAARRQP